MNGVSTRHLAESVHLISTSGHAQDRFFCFQYCSFSGQHGSGLSWSAGRPTRGDGYQYEQRDLMMDEYDFSNAGRSRFSGEGARLVPRSISIPLSWIISPSAPRRAGSR
jgi:hypothetical protein